jgi:hypothetical protein
LRGEEQSAIFRSLLGATWGVLSSVAASDHLTETDAQGLLATYKQRIARTEREYVKRATRQAQVLYLRGTVRGAVLWGWLAGSVLVALWFASPTVHPHLSHESVLIGLGCAAAGASGSLASIIWRVTGRSFSIDHELTRGTYLWLASFRPLLGAIFGVALYFVLKSGLLQPGQTTEGTSDQQIYLYLFVAFLAGFSERLAPDVFTASERALGGPSQAQRANQHEATAGTEPAERLTSRD